VEILLILLLLGVFVGPSAYRFYENYRARKRGVKVEGKKGPSYGRRMLGMLTPVFILIAFLIALMVGLKYLEARGTFALPPGVSSLQAQPSPTP
jgi:hypothetical protein